MDRSTRLTVEFRLSPPALGYDVDMRLERYGDRWIAEGDVSGSRRVALGASPRAALTAALDPLGRSAVALLLADLGLLRPSYDILVQETSAAAH